MIILVVEEMAVEAVRKVGYKKTEVAPLLTLVLMDRLEFGQTVSI
jgi:hypothetical protein